MIKLAVVGALLTGGLLQTFAQTTTQVVYNVTITLTGFGQATDTTLDPVKLTTKDLITELGTAKAVTFSPKAKLILISGGVNTNGPAFFVRDITGTNILDTDVNSLLSLNIVDDVHKSTGTGARTAISRIAVVHFVLTGTTQTFDLTGVMSVTEGEILFHGGIVEDHGLKTATGQVSGSGEIKNHAGTVEHSVVKGTISATGGKPETL